MLLKHGKLSPSDQEHQRMLDPFVVLLTDCLKSKYNKVQFVVSKEHRKRFYSYLS